MRKFGPISSGAAVGDSNLATATGSSTHVVTGTILGVVLKYTGSPPATTEVSIQSKAEDTPAYDLIPKVVGNTDGIFYPRVEVYTGVYHVVPTPLHNIVTVKIDKANANNYVQAWLFLGD